MPTFKGYWTARVRQEFTVEADTEDEARGLLQSWETNPRGVIELLDVTVHDLEEVNDDAHL